MSGRERGSEAAAELLRAHPPTLDEVAKARGERQLLTAAAKPRAAAQDGTASTASRRGGRWVAGVGIAAAAALLLWLRPWASPDEQPVARFELREVDATSQRGTLEVGSILETGQGEVAEVAVDDSRVRLAPGSRMRIATLSEGRTDLELERGEVTVEFHPRQRGREHLTVSTAHARVEVVGTVFTVRARETETDVEVREGVVRVVPLRAGGPRELHAGESATVGAPQPSAAASPSAGSPSEANGEPGREAASEPERVVPAAEEAAEGEAPAPPRPPSPAERLATARRWLTHGRVDRAEPELRAVLAARGPAAVHAEAATLLGDLTQRSGRLEEAASLYARAATLGEGGVVGHNAIYALARLQERRLRDRAAARASYARYLDEAPEGALASQARHALCRLGDRARCEGAP